MKRTVAVTKRMQTSTEDPLNDSNSNPPIFEDIKFHNQLVR